MVHYSYIQSCYPFELPLASQPHFFACCWMIRMKFNWLRKSFVKLSLLYFPLASLIFSQHLFCEIKNDKEFPSRSVSLLLALSDLFPGQRIFILGIHCTLMQPNTFSYHQMAIAGVSGWPDRHRHEHHSIAFIIPQLALIDVTWKTLINNVTRTAAGWGCYGVMGVEMKQGKN